MTLNSDCYYAISKYLTDTDHLNFCTVVDIEVNMSSFSKGFINLLEYHTMILHNLNINLKKVLKHMNLKCYQEISEEFIRLYENEIDWWKVSQINHLTYGFLREFKDKIDWEALSTFRKLSEDFINDFKDAVNWKCISEKQTLSEDFIRENAEFVDWKEISSNQKLSENFIKEFKNVVCWREISLKQKLSKSFIRDYQDYVDWFCIASTWSCDDLDSEKFFEEFQHRDNWETIKRGYNIAKLRWESCKEREKDEDLRRFWHCTL